MPTFDQDVLTVLDTIDRHMGVCICQSYQGETHDVNPPCARRIIAADIVRALAATSDWTPRRMEAAHNGDQGWLVVTRYPRSTIYGVALDERKGTRFHTREDYLRAREGALQAGLHVPSIR